MQSAPDIDYKHLYDESQLRILSAAKRSGMLYSLLGTCKMHGIEPTAWLIDVLKRIPTHPINRIKELLPHNWQ